MSGFVILLTVTVAYALLAARLDRWSITGPMVFVAAGLALGSDGFGVLDLRLGNEVVLTFTEVTLAALLFADATSVPLRDLEGTDGRLLGVSLLLTIAFGTVVGLALVPELGWAGAALIASVLAPTDAALGMAVVTDRAVPVRIRRALNVESGLNDGIVTPFVTVFLAALLSEEGVEKGPWLVDAVGQMGRAVLVAALVGGLGGWLLSRASRRGWTSGVSEQLAVLALAILAYVGAVGIDGNGFVSAFAAGVIFGAVGRPRHEAIDFTEHASLFASYMVWVVFGASFVGPVLTGAVDTFAIAYALCSLTVVRMVPVAIALAGKGFGARTIAFMGCSARGDSRRWCSPCSPWRSSERRRSTCRCSRSRRGRSCSRSSCTGSRLVPSPRRTARASAPEIRRRRSSSSWPSLGCDGGSSERREGRSVVDRPLRAG
jgi:NhaP-type Na+/H+ or K+/H+ antiporter